MIFIVLLLNSANSNSQNLISNSSFEIITSCPTDNNQLNLTSNWINPTNGSIDLYNSCYLNDFYIGVPSNSLGYENANEGEGYVGGFLYSRQDISIPNIREYIQTQLIDTLNSCFIYEISFFVSLADSSHYAINSIGAFLGDSAIHRDDFYCFSYYEPQVNNSKNRMLDNKNGWTKIEGKFVAQGNEHYLTIGNFDPDDELDTLATNGNLNSTYAFAYYYIDNVSLTQFADASMIANAGQDAGIAVGDSIFIGQEISNLNCTWTELGGGTIATNTSGLYVKPTVTTTYVVEQNLCGTITTDTVQIFVHGVGLDEQQMENGLVIYPNPNSGKFILKSEGLSSNSIIYVLDMLGKIVQFTSINGENGLLEIDIEAESGIYTIQLINSNSIENVKIKINR